MPVAMALGVLAAPTAIGILYDRRYGGAGVIFAILVARLMARSLAIVQFQHLMATAEVSLATRAYLAAAIAQGVLLATLGRHYGVLGIAASAATVSTLIQTGVQTVLMRLRGENCVHNYALVVAWIAVSLTGLWMMRGF